MLQWSRRNVSALRLQPGTQRWYRYAKRSWEPVTVAGKRVRTMGLLTDIANKMAADERAQQLEDRLVDAIADAIKVVVDEDVDREGQMDTARLSLAIFRALARVAGQ
jgi:hypothetical protein